MLGLTQLTHVSCKHNLAAPTMVGSVAVATAGGWAKAKVKAAVALDVVAGAVAVAAAAGRRKAAADDSGMCLVYWNYWFLPCRAAESLGLTQVAHVGSKQNLEMSTMGQPPHDHWPTYDYRPSHPCAFHEQRCTPPVPKKSGTTKCVLPTSSYDTSCCQLCQSYLDAVLTVNS